MAKLGPLWTGHPHGVLGTTLIALTGPGLATTLAWLDVRVPTTMAAMLYVLVVAVCSATGGAAAGIGASIVSFLALNFFFTPPHHTFAVGKTEDLIALVAFLVVSIITGLLLSAALKERARTERREGQTRLVNRFTSRLLKGDALETVLQDFAERLTALFELARVEIRTMMTEPVIVASTRRIPSGESYQIELTSKLCLVGEMFVTAPAAKGEISTKTSELYFGASQDNLRWRSKACD